MGCERIDFPGGMGFACSRGLNRERCDTCGKPAVALCDYPLAGTKAGKTCDRKMCGTCRVKAGEGKDYCRAHAACPPPTIIESVPGAVVGSRTYRALHLVRDVVLALPANQRVVSGHAAGVDIVAEVAARQRGLPTSIYPVRVPSNAGKAAFAKAALARNTLIADEATEGDAFVNAESRGTWDTIQKFKGLGKVVRVHEEPPPAEHALLLYTAPHPNTRQAPKGYRGPCMLDITRGSGGEAGAPFAPSADLLGEAKRRMAVDPESAWAWYAPRYREEMGRSWKAKRAAWDALLARNVIFAACYCPGRERCHRGLLAGFVVKAGEHVGRRVVDGGEVPC